MNSQFPTMKTPITPADGDLLIVGDVSNVNEIEDVTVAGLRLALGQVIERSVVGTGSAVSVADGTAPIVIPAIMAGLNLTDVVAGVYNKGVTGATSVQVRRARMADAIGDSTTQFDITNPSGNTARYTYDTTGTDPGIEDDPASIEVGDQIVIAAQNFAAANNGQFVITGVGDNYFEVSNASVSAETNKTIGTGSITPIWHRNMLSTAVTIGDEFYASDGVVNASYDDLAEGDMLYIDVDAIHSGTAPNGLSVALYFRG